MNAMTGPMPSVLTSPVQNVLRIRQILLEAAGSAVTIAANSCGKERLLARKTPQPEPIGAILRRQRVEVLRLGLREMARLIDTAPAHLTDIEKGRRSPSDQLLGRIAEAYQIKESALRFGWSKSDPNVGQISTQDATAAEVAPQLMQFAKTYAPAQWHELLEEAKRIAGKRGAK